MCRYVLFWLIRQGKLLLADTVEGRHCISCELFLWLLVCYLYCVCVSHAARNSREEKQFHSKFEIDLDMTLPQRHREIERGERGRQREGCLAVHGARHKGGLISVGGGGLGVKVIGEPLRPNHFKAARLRKLTLPLSLSHSLSLSLPLSSALLKAASS